ncbi:Guanine nucleotide-exchange factor SEC12 [Yarrowia sp. E02]|nr:Guanine nucleotide-exchange factor SEC12 [Yarrowia sp. E02]
MSLRGLELDYPLFVAEFLDKDHVIVGGGGGEGNHGIPNKLTVVKVKGPEQPKKISEIVLSKKEDNPTSLAIFDKNTIFAGVNSNSASLKSGTNQHLRHFSLSDDLEKWSETKSTQVFEDVGILDYQKGALAVPKHKSVIVSNSTAPGYIYSIGAKDHAVNFQEKTEGEINSISLSLDESKFVYATDKKLVVANSEDGEHIFNSEAIKGETFSRAAFLKSSAVVAAITVGAKDGIKLVKMHGEKFEEVSFSSYKNLKKVTALACYDKYIFTAHQDLSLSIFSAENLRLLKQFKEAHEFAITRVALNEDETMAVSVSASNTLGVIDIPADGNFGGNKLFDIIILTILILFVAIAYQKIVGDRQW